MANTCGLFGNLVPNIFIDKVFLEEALVDTNNDGTFDLQTPKVSINLKVIDSLSSGGTFSIIGDALEIQNGNQNIDFKKYFKVWLVLSDTQELTDKFQTFFESGGYGGSFTWTQENIETGQFDGSKTLVDFTDQYVNADGDTEVLSSYTFDIDENNKLEHLTVFAYIQLDTNTLESDFDIELPLSLKGIVGEFQSQITIQNSAVVADNVQDFRIRDEIDAYIAQLDLTQAVQQTFPEQRDILNQALSKNSYFSEILVTKDAARNARFYFAFDYGKYVLENTKFSGLVSKMSKEAKTQIINNSQIVKFILRRGQVKQQAAKNVLGSPVQNAVFSDETIQEPVILSLDDSKLTEIGLILSEQPEVSDSLIRHFTGIDSELGDIENGFYQYSIDIEIVDGFIPVMREVLANLSNAVASYNNYVALANIPGVYDIQNRKFTSTPANPSSVIDDEGDVVLPDSGQEIMESFGNDKLIDIINTYLNSLDLFVDIDVPFANNETVRRILQDSIGRNISPNIGSVDGIILFQDLMTQLLGIINDVLSVGSNSVGVEATQTNRPADSVSTLKTTSISTTETFDNTIGARFINESYIDNIGAGTDTTFSGLNIYTGNSLAEASPSLVSPESQVLDAQERLANNNITFETIPSKVAANIEDVLQGSRLSSTNFLGADSEGAVGNLNTQNLSATDLEVIKFEDLVPPPAQSLAAFNVQSENVNEILSTSDLQTEVDVLVGFIVPEIINVAEYQQNLVNKYMIRDAKFETKQLGELTTPVATDRFYLCRQTRRSDVEVVDSYFLLSPVSATFETPSEITAEGVTGIFSEEETTSTTGGTGTTGAPGRPGPSGTFGGLSIGGAGEDEVGVGTQGTTGDPGGGADELL